MLPGDCGFGKVVGGGVIMKLMENAAGDASHNITPPALCNSGAPGRSTGEFHDISLCYDVWTVLQLMLSIMESMHVVKSRLVCHCNTSIIRR